MAGVNERVAMRKDIYSWLNEVHGDVIKDVHDAALDAAIDGEEAMRLTIDTTPSDLSRVPKSHRNWTGNMRDLIDSDVKSNSNWVEIKVGWLKLGSDDQYILIQEQGGSVQGKIVSAMNAARNAEIVMRNVLERRGYL